MATDMAQDKPDAETAASAGLLDDEGVPFTEGDEAAEDVAAEEPYETIPWFPKPERVPESHWIDLWQHGRENALVVVLPMGYEPDPRQTVGICTIARYLVGLTPHDIQIALYLPRLLLDARGLDVWRVTRLPGETDFLTLFAGDLPDNARNDSTEGRPCLPARFNVPRWDLTKVQRDRLELVGNVLLTRPLELDYARLPPL